jgi:nicotinamidase-related amidase
MKLDPSRTALVIVDMQNDFCHVDGYYARAGRDISVLAKAAGPCRTALEKARSARMAVVYTRLVYDPVQGAMEERHELRPKRWTASGDRLIPGTWGADVIDELAPRHGEIVIDKIGYSAFEGTGLEAELKARGVKTLVFTGVVTYACVLASAFSAFDRNFDVLLASDAVGTWNEGLGGATHDIVDLLLGRTVTLADLDFAGKQPVTNSH